MLVCDMRISGVLTPKLPKRFALLIFLNISILTFGCTPKETQKYCPNDQRPLTWNELQLFLTVGNSIGLQEDELYAVKDDAQNRLVYFQYVDGSIFIVSPQEVEEVKVICGSEFSGSPEISPTVPKWEARADAGLEA